MKSSNGRGRCRQFGIRIGRFSPGKYNAITDVKGVLIGHSTIIQDIVDEKNQKKSIRTGVTAIMPNEGNIYEQRLFGGNFVLNGAGELSGITQVQEWGIIETPILLTNSLSVGTCSEAAVDYMIQKHPGIGNQHDVILPLVGECDDSWLNDNAGRHVGIENVYAAINSASSGPVIEGNVGGGTGMVTCDFKGGIGTSSRKLPNEMGGYTVGVLVMSNFGNNRDLRIDGLRMGEFFEEFFKGKNIRKENYGSIIVVVATDAPLMSIQLNRLAKRAALGVGRVGSYADHGSGEIILSFSTANKIPRETKKMINKVKFLLDQKIGPLYEAVIDATEEAILNALFMAEDTIGNNGNTAYAIPLDDIQHIMRKKRRIFKNEHPHAP